MMASILDELPKDFLFHAEGVIPTDGPIASARAGPRDQKQPNMVTKV